MQEQKHFYEIVSFSSFTGQCSVSEELVLLRPCQVSEQHHHKPGTKQKQAEHVVYDITNKFRDNLRSTQEASLSTSLGPSPILIIVKPLFPVLFPGIHENDRDLPCCTSSDTGAAVKQHLFQVSVCPTAPEELLPHKTVRVSSCPRKNRNSSTAILPLGNIYSVFYSIPTSSLPMKSEMWSC